jgi:hypothetical protein
MNSCDTSDFLKNCFFAKGLNIASKPRDETAKTSSWLLKPEVTPTHVKRAVSKEPRPKKTRTKAVVTNSAAIRTMPRMAHIMLLDKTPIDIISIGIFSQKVFFVFAYLWRKDAALNSKMVP